MRKFGLIGYPLSHSFSKKHFTEKFGREQIEARYELYPLQSIDELPALLRENSDLEGLNVTIPYKKDVIRFLSDGTEDVKEMGACNCIRIIRGKLFGFNTDVIGFEKSLQEHLKSHHSHALILGSGGAAAAVEFVLRKLGINLTYVSRSKSANNITYSEIDRSIITRNKLIVNTTPLGMHPEVNNYPPIPYEFLSTDHYLFDLVYNPTETVFLAKGRERGAAVKNGEEMLIIQAEESWKIWNAIGELS